MKVKEIETFRMGADSEMPGLLFVRLTTDEGLSGLGDTYFLPGACSNIIHEHIGAVLSGHDALDRESLWRRLYAGFACFGIGGAELRALSAVDMALWDIFGKACGQPLFRLLGGSTRERVPVYNTCAGPRYASIAPGMRAGDGNRTLAGQYDDFDAFLTRPGELAAELVDEGYPGMKIWPFDIAAKANSGRHIRPANLKQSLMPVETIRETVGLDIEIMIDGHGLWMLQPAIEIAKSLEPYHITWLEDLTLADNPTVLRQLAESTSIPISVSEFLMTRWGFGPVMESGGAGIIMMDPGFTGGVTEARKIIDMAERHGLAVTFHDCDGPVNFTVGLHLAAAATNARYVETVRAFSFSVYPRMVTGLPVPDRGAVAPSEAPGLGVALTEEFLARPDVTRVVSHL